MALREILAKFDFDVDTSKLNLAGSAVSGLAKGIQKFGSLISGSEVIGGIKDFVSGMVDQASAIQDTSARLGINQQDLQQWQLAAKLSGVEAQDLTTSFVTLQKNMAAQAANGAESGGAFKQLGVALRDAGGAMRPTTAVFRDAAIAISKLPAGADRTGAALGVFGKAGAKLIPMFEGGEEGLNGLLGELDKLGGGLSDEAIEALGEQGDAMDRLDAATTSAKGKLALLFIPIITKVTAFVSKMTAAFTSGSGASTHLQAAVVALGVAGAAAGLSMLAPWLPTIAAFLLLYLVIDDVMTALNGGDSVAGDFWKAMGGGDQTSVLGMMGKDAKDLNAQVAKTPGFWNKVGVAFDGVAIGIGRFFADTLPQAAEFAIKDIESWIQGLAVSAAQSVGGWIAGLPNVVGDAITAMIQFVTGAWGDALKSAKQFGADLKNAILEGLGDIKNTIADKLGLSDLIGSNSSAKTAKGGTADLGNAQIAKIQSYYANPVYRPNGEVVPMAEGQKLRDIQNTLNAPANVSITINGDTTDPGTIKQGAEGAYQQVMAGALANFQRVTSKAQGAGAK